MAKQNAGSPEKANRAPKTPREAEKRGEGNAASSEVRVPKEASKIMTQPLPLILDEIEESIKAANLAAKNARDAADEARKAGEKAANEAARVAAEAIGKVEQTAKNALRLAELLNSAIIEASQGLERKLTK